MTSPELLTYADAPGVRLLAATQRMRRALASPSPRLSVPVSISAIARAGIMQPTMRAWALMIGELGPARLPGGALLAADGGEHQTLRLVGVDGACDEHQGSLWALDVRDTALAARDRDGAAVFDAFTRAVYSLPHRDLSHVTAYVASLALSANHTFRESGERVDVEALLHLLASEAHRPDLWSVCGYAYRLVAAVMSAIDMGPSMAQTVVGPELDTIEALSSVERMRLILLLGGAMGQIIDDGPDTEPVLVPHKSSDQSRRPDQIAAAQMGFRVAIACRTGDQDRIMRAVTPLPDSVQPVYGLANILAVRVRGLWAP